MSANGSVNAAASSSHVGGASSKKREEEVVGAFVHQQTTVQLDTMIGHLLPPGSGSSIGKRGHLHCPKATGS